MKHLSSDHEPKTLNCVACGPGYPKQCAACGGLMHMGHIKPARRLFGTDTECDRCGTSEPLPPDPTKAYPIERGYRIELKKYGVMSIVPTHTEQRQLEEANT